MQTVFETERLKFRRWREEDLDCMAEIFSDAEHARFVGGKKECWDAWRVMAMHEGHYNLRGYTLFALEEKTTEQTLGWAGPWCPEGFLEPEIGCALRPSVTGQGFAKEAVIGCLDYVYTKLNWETSISLIEPENKASQAVARSVGANLEGEPMDICGYHVCVWRHLSPKLFREQYS
ncbi:MAG: GNAT family N-acetyltransferase [Pseudomonadota bacterium]